MVEVKKVKQIVKKKYKEIASAGSSCGCCSRGADDPVNSQQVSKNIGYSDKELEISGEANLGLGCGNPVALSKIKEGDTVLDLGSGAGIDCFLAAKKVGETGKVIGVDMTKEMIKKAKLNAEKQGHRNVEFILGDIEKLPLKDSSVDVIISNCVINLAPDKTKVFSEAYRVLKRGGRMFVSDIVLLKELSKEQRNDEDLLAGCVGGALLKEDYISKIKDANFNVEILSEDKEMSKRQYQEIPLESLTIEAVK